MTFAKVRRVKMFSQGIGRGLTFALASPSAHLMAPRYIACTSGRSQFSDTCPSSRIEHSSLPISLSPTHCEVPVGAMDTFVGQVELGRIQSHQNSRRVARKEFHLVDFIVESERIQPLLHPGERGIFNKNRSIERAPGMLIKVPPNISPYSGHFVKVIVALWMPMKPFPSSWIKDRKSAFC